MLNTTAPCVTEKHCVHSHGSCTDHIKERMENVYKGGLYAISTTIYIFPIDVAIVNEN